MPPRVCGNCKNWQEGKCSKFAGHYPNNSTLAEGCKKYMYIHKKGDPGGEEYRAVDFEQEKTEGGGTVEKEG